MTDALRLFLIEDDDDIALLMRRALERAGHQVTRCRTAADALIVLGHSHFDLVLLDQKLPDMSGKDLLQALAREGILVPVLMVTAYADAQIATQVLRAGALDFVIKDPALTFLSELPKRVLESVTRHRLQYMNSLLIEALESARDGILIIDVQHRVILNVNRAVEGLTGYSRQELLDQKVLSAESKVLCGEGDHGPKAPAPPADQQPAALFGDSSEFYEELWNTVLARLGWQGERAIRRKDGSLVEVSLTVSPIVNSQGQLMNCVAILRDITERKQLERQLLQAQKMQSVGTLAGGVAHEFNNLLAGINGYASLGLREPGLTPTLREFLQHIVDLSERAASLTRQLLTFARKPALSRRPLPVLELLRSTAELVQRTLHCEVVLEVQDEADGGPLLVEADANQLQQALVNLALNARDATRVAAAAWDDEAGARPPQGTAPPRITFRLRSVLLTGEWPAFPQNVPPGDYVLLEVADQGCGMSEKVLSQALDPFFTTKEVGQGTGLGLPMVFGIIQGHQGSLAIDTAPGQGTTVRLYLPRMVALGEQDVDGLPFEAGQVLEPESTPGRAILVVDDEEAVQDVVRRFLEIAGHRVSVARSGEEALTLLGNGRSFDLVILDLMMPREDGVSTFQRIRQRRPQLPVLLCTGLPQADPAPQLLEAGAVGLLRKPFRMNELWYAVKQALAPAGGEAP
jgi:two-component system, cell cycle sensor histidine kinase and response regulator CckA